MSTFQLRINSLSIPQIYDWQSAFQSQAIPIPVFTTPANAPPAARASVNFMGRLIRELLLQTDTRRTIYVDSNQGWCFKFELAAVLTLRLQAGLR